MTLPEPPCGPLPESLERAKCFRLCACANFRVAKLLLQLIVGLG
jgi:hypothetical protein